MRVVVLLLVLVALGSVRLARNGFGLNQNSAELPREGSVDD